MQLILTQIIVSGAVFYTFYSIVKLFKLPKKKLCGCSLKSCGKFDSS